MERLQKITKKVVEAITDHARSLGWVYADFAIDGKNKNAGDCILVSQHALDYQRGLRKQQVALAHDGEDGDIEVEKE